MSSEVKLEIVRSEDAEKIRDMMMEIYQDEALRWFKDNKKPFIPGYNSIDMQRYHTWDHKYYKIMYDENIVGVLLVSSTGREHGRIDRFYVHPDHQDKGIGSKVIKRVEELFPQIKWWTLDTTQQSPRNHHFYEKHGYQLLGEDEDEKYYGKVLDESIYELENYFWDQDFSYKNIRRSNISNTDLYDSNMASARFSNMNLYGNIYLNSNLSDNRFTNVNMTGSIFGDSNMSKVEICHVSLSEAYLHDINLNVDKEKCSIVMERCELANSKIIESNLENMSIEDCNLNGMTINGINVLDALEYYQKSMNK